MPTSNAGVAATLAAGTTTLLASVSSWPNQVGPVMAAIGVVVTSGLGMLTVVDHFRMRRKKEWDEVNKDLLSVQLAKANETLELFQKTSADNQESMRKSLHDLRSDAASAEAKNHELREQLADLSARLYETDVALNEANRQLRETTRKYDESQAGQDSLRKELASYKKQSQINSDRLDALENLSGPTPVVVVNTPDRPIPTVEATV